VTFLVEANISHYPIISENSKFKDGTVLHTSADINVEEAREGVISQKSALPVFSVVN